MARPAGARNQDYAAKRKALLEAAADYVLRDDVQTPSFRQLSMATGASEPTLKHYFKSRSGLIIAIIEHFDDLCAPMRDHLQKNFDSIETALQDYKTFATRVSEDTNFIRSHVFALRESFLDTDVFQAYIHHLVEPCTQALAERLVNSPGGPTDYPSARMAAAQIFANVLFMACRKHLLESGSPYAPDLDQNFELMTNWLLYGLVNDPDGAGKPQ